MPARRFLSAMILVLIVGSVFNIVLWKTNSPGSTAALRMAVGHELIDLARAEKPSLPVKVGFALSLRTVAAGGVLIVPDIGSVDRKQIEFLSDMTIQVEYYVVQLDQDEVDALESVESIEGIGKLHFNDKDSSAYVIAWSPNGMPVEAMRFYLAPSGAAVIIDERIVRERDL